MSGLALEVAVNRWLKPAFEAAGFSNAIVGKEAPNDPDWSPEDARYSVIRWLPSTTENASGPNVHDPRSGEILNAHIQFYQNVQRLVLAWSFTQTAAVDPRVRKIPFADDVMGRALDMSVDYMKTRVQFGKPIGSFQALAHRAVDLHIQRELSSAVLDDAVALFDGAATAARRSAMASRVKARCSEAGLRITREAIQIHGAIGFTDEYDAGLYLKRAMTLSAWLGNAAQHRRRYAQLIEADREAGASA